MINDYLYSFYEIYKAPFWLFIIAIGLIMIFYDAPILIKKSNSDATIIKTIGWVYIIGGSLIFLFIQIMR